MRKNLIKKILDRTNSMKALNFRRIIREVLNGVAFFLLLYMVNLYITMIGSNLYIRHGINIFPPFGITPLLPAFILQFLLMVLLPSIAGLLLFYYGVKRKTHPVLHFFFAFLALYPVFTNLLSFWRQATCYSCNHLAYLITLHRFHSLNYQFIILLYSIFPIIFIARKYSRSQILWNVIIFIFSLYCYSFFFGGYYNLFFLPIRIPIWLPF
jgi:hypothetical protein